MGRGLIVGLNEVGDRVERPHRWDRLDLIVWSAGPGLSREDILEITGIAEQVRAVFHISDRFCQLLIGVPEGHRWDVSEVIGSLGYDYAWLRSGVRGRVAAGI